MTNLDNNPYSLSQESLPSEEPLWPAEMQEAFARYPQLEVGRDFNVRVMQRLQARAQPTMLDRVAEIFARPLPKLLGSFGMGTLMLLPALWVMKPFGEGTKVSNTAVSNGPETSSLMAQNLPSSTLRASALSNAAALRYGALMREELGEMTAPPAKNASTGSRLHRATPILNDPRRRSLCPHPRAPLA